MYNRRTSNFPTTVNTQERVGLRGLRTRETRGSQVGPKPRVRAIGYIRVSTEKQAAEGISLDAQKIRLQAHCIAVDIDLADIVIDDGYSAKSLERPGLQRALSVLTSRQADALVVVKLDRLTRSGRGGQYKDLQ